jgi:hypothetical protein
MQNISRFIFLLFIICFAVYFLFVNKNYKEHFVNQENENAANMAIYQEQLAAEGLLLPKSNKNAMEDIIKKIYLSSLNRSPSQNEVDFFFVYSSQREITEAELIDVISSSGDVVSASLNANKETPVDGTVYGNEDDIIRIYNEILERNPDRKELFHYAKLIKTDTNFNLEKLKTLLYGSQEYHRLEDMQTNLVNSSLMENVTDRQIILMVMTAYKEVVGNSDIDDDTLRFLKKKLLLFNLDENKLKKFIKDFVANSSIDPSILQETIINEAITLQEKQNKFNAQAQSQQQKLKAEADLLAQQQQKIQQVLSELNSLSIDQKQQQCHELDGKQYCLLQSANKVVIESLLNSTNNDMDSTNVLDSIKQQASCVFDLNKEAGGSGATDKNGSQTMADLVGNRNSQVIKETCFRNKKYTDVDEDLILRDDQAWSVPQKRAPVCQGTFDNYQPNLDQTALVGTLLKDSQNTSVGSILPFNPPRYSGTTL